MRMISWFWTLSPGRLSKGPVLTIHHFEVALGIASLFSWHGVQFWLHYKLAGLFRDEDRFDEAHAHIEHAKSHTANSHYRLGLAMKRQAWIWYDQHRLTGAKSGSEASWVA